MSSENYKRAGAICAAIGKFFPLDIARAWQAETMRLWARRWGDFTPVEQSYILYGLARAKENLPPGASTEKIDGMIEEIETWQAEFMEPDRMPSAAGLRFWKATDPQLYAELEMRWLAGWPFKIRTGHEKHVDAGSGTIATYGHWLEVIDDPHGNAAAIIAKHRGGV